MQSALATLKDVFAWLGTVWLWVGVGLAVLILILRLALKALFRAMRKEESRFKMPPPRIQLFPLTRPELMQDESAQSLIVPLLQAGFQAAGEYQVREMPKTQIAGFVHQASSVSAMVYHYGRLTFCDLVTEYEDGTSLTYANHSVGEGFPRSPRHAVRRFPEVSPALLHQRMVVERPAGLCRRVSIETFAVRMETAYAESQNWLADRGGYTLDELKRTFQAPGQTLNEEEMLFLRERVAEQALQNWWMLQTSLPTSWIEASESLIIIHDELSLFAVVYRYSKWTGDWNTTESDIPPGVTSAREAFAALNLRCGGLFKKVWEKETPLAADFYFRQDQFEEGTTNG